MPSPLAVVCVVDDDAAVRNALKFALEVEGLVVRDYDGPVALLQDRHLPPYDLLVVDYRMPVMDGLELVAALRERGMQCPTIMITGRANKDLLERAARLDIHLVLEKPLVDGALLGAIKSALEARR